MSWYRKSQTDDFPCRDCGVNVGDIKESCYRETDNIWAVTREDRGAGQYRRSDSFINDDLSKDCIEYALAVAKSTAASLGCEIISTTLIGSYSKKSVGLYRKDIDVMVTVKDAKIALNKRHLAKDACGKPVDIFLSDGTNTLVGVQVSPQEIVFRKMPRSIQKHKAL